MKFMLFFFMLNISYGVTLNYIDWWEQFAPSTRPFYDEGIPQNQLSKIIVGRYHEMRNRGDIEYLHQGVDYALNKYIPILASGSGKIIFAEWSPGYGNTIIIDHGEYIENGKTYHVKTLYAHIQKYRTLENEAVFQRDIIGYVGSTGSADGNHIHFEVIVNDKRVFPGQYFKRKED